MRLEFEIVHGCLVIHSDTLLTDRYTDLRKPGCELAHRILEIPGIHGGWIERYEATLSKGKLFDWPPIQEAAERVLREYGETRHG